MIIKIDDDSLQDKSKEEIAKIITDMLHGEFNFPGVKIYGDPPEDNELKEYNYLNSEFKKELTELINKYSLENDSNTPDWCISSYIINSLLVMTCLINGRDVHLSG